MVSQQELEALIAEAKRLGSRYYAMTGRHLGITGEIGECEVVRLLGLRRAAVRQAGYDAETTNSEGRTERVQIKSRQIVEPSTTGHRTGTIAVEKEWDVVLLVLLDKNYEATAIYRAERSALEGLLQGRRRTDPPVSAFISIGRKIWPPTVVASVG